MDNLRCLDSSKEMEPSLQVRGQSLIQCCKGIAVERYQSCKKANWVLYGRDYRILPIDRLHTCHDPSDTILAEELNNFFSCFEGQSPDTNHCFLVLQEHQVRQWLKPVNIRKAAGLDGVLGKVLCACADPSGGVLTRMTITLTGHYVKVAWRQQPSFLCQSDLLQSLNDYRPIALTSAVMMLWEDYPAAHKGLPPTELGLSSVWIQGKQIDRRRHCHSPTHSCHLKQPGNYIRRLFIDYSRMFNMIIPGILVDKLIIIGSSPSNCAWIWDFLSNCPQGVKTGAACSSTLSLSMDSLQGYMLSPLLYALYTYDCTPAQHHQ